jgi:trehalose 6-phosphate phosphatase
MIYIFNAWEDIINQIRSHTGLILLFDFDGTLTPIVDRPEAATLADDLRSLLKALASKKGMTLGVVSGRALSDLKSKVNILNIIYAGNHGLEIEGPELQFIHPLMQEFKSTMRILSQVMNKTMAKIKGLFIEDKGLTLSVHYRLVESPDKEIEVKNMFERVVGVARMLGKVRTTSGKKVYEVRPAIDWDKGKAIEHVISHYRERGKHIEKALAIYLGDDLTDEDAFKSIAKYRGISIYVGSPDHESSAAYYLNTVDDVKLFMEKLLLAVQDK